MLALLLSVQFPYASIEYVKLAEERDRQLKRRKAEQEQMQTLQQTTQQQQIELESAKEERDAERELREELAQQKAAEQEKSVRLENQLRSLQSQKEETDTKHNEFLKQFAQMSTDVYSERLLLQEQKREMQRRLQTLAVQRDALRSTQLSMQTELRQRVAEAEQEKQRLQQELQSLTAAAQAAEAAGASVAERERVEREERLIKVVNDAHAEEIQKLQKKIDTCMAQADAKDKEVKDSGMHVFSEEEFEQLARENHELKGLTTMLDDILKHQLHPLLEREGERFCIITKGELDRDYIRRLGLTQLPTQKQMAEGCTDKQQQWAFEVEAWAAALIGAEPYEATILPWLDTNAAFIRDPKTGRFTSIREEVTVHVPKKVTLKMPDGSVRTSQAPPVTLDPKFFLALKKHVKRPDQARKIMEYIMETFNEVNEHTDQAVCVSMGMHSSYACYLICAPSLSAHPSIFCLRLCSV